MMLIERLRSLFSDNTVSLAPVRTATVPASAAAFMKADSVTASDPLSAFNHPEPLPNWLIDDEVLRDEGVLFGLSEARPDGKVAQIRAAFTQQVAPLNGLIEQYTEKIAELNLFIEQRENHLTALREQLTELHNSQPAPTNLIRTVVSLCLSVLMCIGNFYLIDVTLQSSFPNRWIAVGVFLAGMFNLFGRTSFFYETGTRLSGRRVVEEVGLPLAASIFVLVQSLQTQTIGAAIGLFVFVFFIFLLAGKLLLSLLTALQNELDIILRNQRLMVSKKQFLPIWEREIDRLEQEIDGMRTQKWPVITSLNQAEAEINQLNAQRERLVNLFLSEFELARGLRERLTEQQLKSMMNYNRVANTMTNQA